MVDLKKLYFFKVVAESGHMTKAAELLETTQPFLSRSIQSLEKELNCQLFDRTGRGIVLNEAGRAYYYYVNALFGNLEDGSKAVQQFLDAHDNTVRVGTNACSFLPTFFHYAREHYKKLMIRQETHAFPKLLERLQNGEIDFAMAVRPDELPELENISTLPLMTDRMHLIFSKDSCYADMSVLDFKDIASMPVISAPRELGFTDTLLYQFELHGAQPNVVIQTTDIAIIPKYVSYNLGMSALPECVLRDMCKAYHITHATLSGDTFKARLYLLWNHNRFQSAAAQTFRQLAKDFYLS